MSTFGERLKELREEAGLTQEELALDIGVTKNTVYRWETDALPSSKPGDAGDDSRNHRSCISDRQKTWGVKVESCCQFSIIIITNWHGD